MIDAGAPRNAPATQMHGFLSRDGMPPADLLAEGRDEVTGYGVELTDGRVVARTAVFVRPGNLPHDDGLLTGLGCERNEASFPLVDGAGLTSVPGVWAAGNVADPRAQVITSAGAGSAAAIAINADLVQQDAERAIADLAERPFSAVTEARVSALVPGDHRHGL